MDSAMNALMEYLEEFTFSQLVATLVLIIVIVRGVERGWKEIKERLQTYYKKQKGIEIKETTLANHTEEIRQLSERFDKVVVAIESQYNTLINKIEEQNAHVNQIEEDGKRRDCAILRDRILSGMRHFSQNRDENGQVHISLTDHENMTHLFEEYFACGGNGTVKALYKEFRTWIIDNLIFK